MHSRFLRASYVALGAVLLSLMLTSCKNATATVNVTNKWVSGNQICFLFTVSGLPANTTTYVSFQLGTGGEVRSFHTFDLGNGTYQVCLPLPRSDAANPRYSAYVYVADKTKTRPYAPPVPPGTPAFNTWNDLLKKEWDRENIIDQQTTGDIGTTAPTIPAGTTVNPPELP